MVKIYSNFAMNHDQWLPPHLSLCLTACLWALSGLPKSFSQPNRLFPSYSKTLCQSEAKCEVIDMSEKYFILSCKYNSFSQKRFCT